jgi:signal transduction histidine kinase/amino acid transporter
MKIPSPNISPNISMKLPRTLSAVETWGFGVGGALTAWIPFVANLNAALGEQGIFVLVPGLILGILLNYQIKRLASNYIDVAGGTPNYITQLLKSYPAIARYAAHAYFVGWSMIVSINAFFLTDLIQVPLQISGISAPKQLLQITFLAVPFVLAFSGTRALSILHSIFALLGISFSLMFCAQGLGWLAFAPSSPGFFPQNLSPPSWGDWGKWLFVTIGFTYACETVSCFVADSSKPQRTIKFLEYAAWLMPLICGGGYWIFMRLLPLRAVADDYGVSLMTNSAVFFWGSSAANLVNFGIMILYLLNAATAVSVCPRILYQLAVDRHASPVFGVVSRRGALTPSLIMILVWNVIFLFLGIDILEILIAITSFSSCLVFIILHWGMWQHRHTKLVLYPYVVLVMLLLEIALFLWAIIAWSIPGAVAGFLLPFTTILIDLGVRHLPGKIFQPQWWILRYRTRPKPPAKDFVLFQVSILILLICSTLFIGWWFGSNINKSLPGRETLILQLIVIVAFVGIGIACWTSIPQVVAIAEAREATEHLFTVAQDSIIVVNEFGLIQQVNPATEVFFDTSTSKLLKTHLNHWLPNLANSPQIWLRRSEQILNLPHQESRILDVSISDTPHQSYNEYVVILRDISLNKQAEAILRDSEAQMREQAKKLAAQLVQSEKMSSLGQLVAGVAHEINNPTTFIYGNLSPAKKYIDDLLSHLKYYQQVYPNHDAKIQAHADEIEIDFIAEDLPKLLNSINIGAERIQNIVRSLRTFSRLDEAKLKAVDIHESIDSTLMILQSRLKAQPRRKEIQVIKAYGELPLIECNGGEINQVFMNLLVNAIDAFDASETTAPVNSTHPKIEIITQTLDQNHIKISIIDNGCGIPTEITSRIFDPFFTTKEVGKGTGLGLSISYEIITQKHSGKLQCISAIGKGTEFIIEIPRCSNQA